MFAESVCSPPCDLELKEGEIHIWCVGLEQPLSRLQKFSQILNADERRRAERFLFEQDRRYFVSRHGTLRTILGRYLKIAPSELNFHHGTHGKPALAWTSYEAPIHFNLSHSRGVALFGFTRGHAIGVDIEYLHDIPEMEQIAERFFSMKENEVFRTLPRSQKKEAFFHCWTCKEAFMKAIGDGLSRPLDTFDISLVPGEPTKLLSIEGDSKEASQWSIQDFKPIPNYVSAFAVRRHDFETKRWQWKAT
jgi:4'-phosphopantetheinyl transferase